MIDPNMHLKAIDCLHIRTHHDTGIIDEYVQVINLWMKKQKSKGVNSNI